MSIQFTAHNIRLDDGTYTIPGESLIADHPWYLSARAVLDTVFPGDKTGLRIADLGALEGGYSVEFARLGFESVGIEVRDSNFAACTYVKEGTSLPNLRFVQDDVLNIGNYGEFDAIFCCGLLYHLDQPAAYLRALGKCTKRVLIVQTHFAPWADAPAANYGLSPLCFNEGMAGRWFSEFGDDETFQRREELKWASWDNRQSFWLTRENLLQSLYDAGFNLVFEQFDQLAPQIAENMITGSYFTNSRGTFVGVKTQR